MQTFRPMALQTAALFSVASTASYGPGGCVSLHRSSAGTCVMQTKCDNHDVTNFDFSFDCVVSASNITTHSLGFGSLDTEEEYDTGVLCSDCQPPKTKVTKATAKVTSARAASAKALNSKASDHMQAHAQKTRKAPSAAAHISQLKAAAPQTTAPKARKTTRPDMKSPEPKSVAPKSVEPKSVAPKSAEPSLIQNTRTVHSIKQGPTQVQRYGPGACVKTWRDATSGHCIMETDCPDSEDLTVYEFGLLCESHGGELTRHVFGQDSFEHHETFDTLIECEECLSLDEYMDAGKSITYLAQQVESLKGGMENVTADLAKLEAAVGGPGPAPAPAPVAAAPPAAALMAHRRPAQGHRVRQAQAAVQHAQSTKRTAVKAHGHHSTARAAQRAAVADRKVAKAAGQRKHLRQQRSQRRQQREDDDEDDQEEAQQGEDDEQRDEDEHREDDEQSGEAEQEEAEQTQERDAGGDSAEDSGDDSQDSPSENAAPDDSQQADGEDSEQ